MNTPTNPKERGEDHMTKAKLKELEVENAHLQEEQCTDAIESAISQLEGEFDEGLQAKIREGKLTEDLAESLWTEFTEQLDKLMVCLMRVC